MKSWPASWTSRRPTRRAWRWRGRWCDWHRRWAMTDKNRLLESLGLDISDGVEPDWEALEGSAAENKALLRNLRSLSAIASFHRAAVAEERRPAAPASSLEAQSPARWGHLEILEPIGRGGYAEVFRARDTQLNRDVALKLIRGEGDSPRRVPSVLLEGEHLARVKHPNLVTIHGAAVHEGAFGLWMELVRGATLQELVHRQGPLSSREAALLGIDLCGALAALHRAGLVHGDVKAHNVMREEGGRVVLMDLGAGKELGAAGGPPGEAISGTPLYMAPEILQGGAGDARADVYSLGVLLYFAVTGSYPVTAESLDALRARHARGERNRLRDARPDLPSGFVTAVERALAADPRNRYDSAGEMEQSLGSAAGWTPEAVAAQETPRTRGGAAPPAFFRRRWRAAAGALAAMLLLAVLFVWPGLLTASAYTVEASLHRVRDGMDEVLLPGARVAPGDRLYLELQASQALHVYVMAEDDRGEAFLLYPLPGRSRNPLPAGDRHRLPPAHRGRPYSWGVSSAGGTEHILIVASPSRLRELERSLAELPLPENPAETPALPLDGDALSQLRGIGLLVEDGAREVGRRTAFRLARSLGQGSERAAGVWVRQIDLINPAP
ncbi:MAG: protein kinase [Candidatus Eisenbacteria bacterium]|nr:protein kinase [Candidatus Eisenbacteria bacterium]